MHITAFKTALVQPGNKIFDLLDQALPVLKENSILAVTSKIISLCENNILSKNLSDLSKYQLIKKHADAVLALSPEEEKENYYNIYLTIKNNMLIPSAGIDESNGDDNYIFYPEDIQKSAEQIWTYLRQKNKINHLGILITDSHTTPMRKGVTGIALGWCGFEALYNYIGKPDLFGYPLRVTKINNLDALAAAAVYVMGEGAEQTPLAVMTDMPRIVFQTRPPNPQEINDITISMEQDLYAPLLKKAHWIWRSK